MPLQAAAVLLQAHSRRMTSQQPLVNVELVDVHGRARANAADELAVLKKMKHVYLSGKGLADEEKIETYRATPTVMRISSRYPLKW